MQDMALYSLIHLFTLDIKILRNLEGKTFIIYINIYNNIIILTIYYSSHYHQLNPETQFPTRVTIVNKKVKCPK